MPRKTKFKVKKKKAVVPIKITSLQQLADILDKVTISIEKFENEYYKTLQQMLNSLEALVKSMDKYADKTWNYILFRKMYDLISYIYPTQLTLQFANISPTLASILEDFTKGTRDIFCKRMGISTMPDKPCSASQLNEYVDWVTEMEMQLFNPEDLDKARRLGFPRGFQSAIGRALLYANKATVAADRMKDTAGREFVKLGALDVSGLPPDDQTKARDMIGKIQGELIRDLTQSGLYLDIAKKVKEILLDAALELGMVSDILIDIMFKPPRAPKKEKK